MLAKQADRRRRRGRGVSAEAKGGSGDPQAMLSPAPSPTVGPRGPEQSRGGWVVQRLLKGPLFPDLASLAPISLLGHPEAPEPFGPSAPWGPSQASARPAGGDPQQKHRQEGGPAAVHRPDNRVKAQDTLLGYIQHLCKQTCKPGTAGGPEEAGLGTRPPPQKMDQDSRSSFKAF